MRLALIMRGIMAGDEARSDNETGWLLMRLALIMRGRITGDEARSDNERQDDW